MCYDGFELSSILIVTGSVKFGSPKDVSNVILQRNELSIFPNPSGSTMHIVYYGEVGRYAKMELYDVLGNVVSTVFEGSTSTSPLELSLPVPIGVYYLRAESNNTVLTRKVIRSQ